MRRVCGLVSLVLALASLAALSAALTAPVSPARGRDEIDFAHLNNISFESGTAFHQPLRLQAAGLSEFELPYRYLGNVPALVDVRVVSASNVQLASRRLKLATTAPRFTPIPGLSASFWDGQSAAIASIPTAAPPAGDASVTLSLQRIDSGPEPVVLYIEDPASLDSKPPLVEVPRVAVVAFTRYGREAPLAVYLPLFTSRVLDTSYPWPGLTFPIFALIALFLSFALAGALAFSGREQPGGPRDDRIEAVARS